MRILPFKGLDIVHFGSPRALVKEILGRPDSISNKDGADGAGSEIWNYNKLGLELHYTTDNEHLLDSLIVKSPDVYLGEHKPVGLTETQLKSQFSNIKLDVEDGKFKEYSMEKDKIEFMLRDQIVTKVWVWQKDVLNNDT